MSFVLVQYLTGLTKKYSENDKVDRFQIYGLSQCVLGKGHFCPGHNNVYIDCAVDQTYIKSKNFPLLNYGEIGRTSIDAMQ